MSKQDYSNAELIAALTEEVTCFHKKFNKPKPMPTYWELAEEVTHLHGQLYKLQDENAKLRKLLADLAICACGKYCYGCPHQYDGCDRDERLRELGIEVDS